jgi:hypothetical protein
MSSDTNDTALAEVGARSRQLSPPGDAFSGGSLSMPEKPKPLPRQGTDIVELGASTWRGGFATAVRGRAERMPP